jgi:hypothetical protein
MTVIIAAADVFFYLQVFIGNSDTDTKVNHKLEPPIEARFIRLLPQTWNEHVSLRWELYGCSL